jgi:hypothetical protein
MFRASPAFAFVLTMGVVNLSGDLTYEGGGSINGQFMATLGATAAVVSITAGLGEFLGYALRSGSGYIADKSGMYWAITFIGYAIHTFEGDRGEHAAERETQRRLRVFYAGYGFGWLAGSVAMGLLYDRSRTALAVFAVLVQLASLPLFLAARKRSR